MSGNISNLFSSLINQSSQTSQYPEDTNASATFYMEPSSTQHLFDLIKRCGTFRIKVSPLGYEAHLGQRRFTIVDTSEFIELTLLHADALTQESAEITAELASILLPETDKPLKLQATTVEDERRLFESVSKFFPKYSIRAFNEGQRMRFEFLEQKQREQRIGVGLSKNASSTENASSTGLKKHTTLMGGFLKADEFGYKRSSIYVESDTIGFLMAFTREEGEIVIESTREHFRFLLRGHVIAIDNYQELSKIRLLSPMSLGASELILRVIRFLYDDSAMEKLRTESADASPSIEQTAPSDSSLSSGLFSNFLNNPALLDQPENASNSNTLFHPRNIRNPSNPLNPQSPNHPQNPLNPRSPIRLSFETLKEEDEKLILQSLEKDLSNAFQLGYHNEAQKNRITAHFNPPSSPGYLP